MAEQNPYTPADIANIPKPIVGFFGAIDDHTFDIPFMERVVDLLPQISFVFVGNASSDISQLQKRKNVWLLGQKPYEQIPHYGKCFDIAIMPWKQNRWIQVCNPIKLKEYFALGKPIVSTPFKELQKHLHVVYVSETPEDFAEGIRKALVEDSPEWIAARRRKVENASWESKAHLVMEELLKMIKRGNKPAKAKKRKKLQVCLTASAGGHMSQLLKVAESCKGCKTFCVTTRDVVREKLKEYGNVHIVGECNREHPLRVILVLMRCINVILRERPDVVISTGAAVGCIMCFLGKLLRAKVVWIDSITNVERLSLSGRMVKYIADLFLVQWPELTVKYKNVGYAGVVI